MKKILFFTHNIFTPENPEGYRIHQYFPYLEKLGFSVELLTTKEKFTDVLSSAKSADVVYLQRLLLNPLKFTMLRRSAKKIVYDFDDAVMYGTKGESRTRRSRFARVIRNADAVFCGNSFLCSEAKHYRKDGVFYIPTVVDTDEYTQKQHSDRPAFVVGWTGSSSTSRYLSDIKDIFTYYENDKKIVFKFIADKSPEITTDGRHLIFEKWRKENEKTCFLDFDMGIMPVRDDIWSRGKCGLKLIQYMAAGLPSVTHPVGVAKEMITDGINGFLKEDLNEWKGVIDKLSGDTVLRKRMGDASREYAVDKFSLKQWGPRVSEIINNL